MLRQGRGAIGREVNGGIDREADGGDSGKKIRGTEKGMSPDILSKIKSQSRNQILMSRVRYVKIIL